VNALSWEALGIGILGVWLLVLSLYDLVSYRLPNAGTVPLLVAGLVVAACRAGQPGIWHAAAGALAGLSLGLVPFLKGGFGAGDVKLLAACGSFAGAKGIVYVFGGAVALLGLWALMIWWIGPPLDANKVEVREDGEDRSSVSWVIRDPHRRWKAIPFGPLVSISMVGFWLFS